MDLKVKDRIKFRVLTRFGYKTGERKINAIYPNGYVGVKFDNTREYIIKPDDIIEKL